MTKAPPKRSIQFLRWFCREEYLEEIEGDLTEVFFKQTEHHPLQAKWKFIWSVMQHFRPEYIKPVNYSMHPMAYDRYKNYFNIGWRHLWRNKGFSFINIFGLAIGMAAFVLIMLYIKDESSYDQHHRDGHRIFRVATEVMGKRYASSAAPISGGLKKDFPEVMESTRLLRLPGADKMLLIDEKSRKQFFEINGFYVDSTFFQVFTYDLKYGDMASALDGPNTMVISETVAEKFFGNENPVDRVLKITLPFGDFNYTIKGVFRNTYKSHIPAHLLISLKNKDIGLWLDQSNWALNDIYHTYVKLKPGNNPALFESKLDEFIRRNGADDLKAAGITKSLFIQPVKDIFLHSNYASEIAPNGNMKYLYILGSIALFLLLIACINFMNLSTARSERRAKEVGMRKVIGATKYSLVSQFLIESLLMSMIALLFACLFIQGAIPVFNQLTHKQLSLLQLPHVFLWLVALAGTTGLLAGLYPAFVLSSFMPVAVMQKRWTNTFSAVGIRKALVIFQFTISIVLILGVILISQQMTFLSAQKLGFDKNQKIILPLETNESNKNTLVLKSELLQNAGTISATNADFYPGIEHFGNIHFYAEGKTIHEHVEIILTGADEDYIESLGIKLLQGRGFAKEFTHDSDAVVLNEVAVKELGYDTEHAVGKRIYYEWQGQRNTMTIIGVLKDYHFQSLHQKVKPIALTRPHFFGNPNSYLIVNVKSNDYGSLIHEFEKSWNKINKNSPFAYSFLDSDFQKNYELETRTLALIKYAALFAILIACLGLFGLASFMAEHRVKEIGIRKVLGSSVTQIVMLLSGDFLKLILIAFVIASPIGYKLMLEWLQGFAYHIHISGWVFCAAGISAVLIAFLPIGFQAIKAAIINPIYSLKSE